MVLMPYPKYTTQRTGSNLAFSGYSWNWLMTNVPLLNGGQPCVMSSMGSDETTPANRGDKTVRPSATIFTPRPDISIAKGPVSDSNVKSLQSVVREFVKRPLTPKPS